MSTNGVRAVSLRVRARARRLPLCACFRSVTARTSVFLLLCVLLFVFVCAWICVRCASVSCRAHQRSPTCQTAAPTHALLTAPLQARDASLRAELTAGSIAIGARRRNVPPAAVRSALAVSDALELNEATAGECGTKAQLHTGSLSALASTQLHLCSTPSRTTCARPSNCTLSCAPLNCTRSVHCSSFAPMHRVSTPQRNAHW